MCVYAHVHASVCTHEHMCAVCMIACAHISSLLTLKFHFFQDFRSLHILKYILMNISRNCINLCVHCVKQMSTSQLEHCRKPSTDTYLVDFNDN